MTSKIMTAVACAAVLSAVSAGQAHAEDRQLRYKPSELTTNEGAADVYARINAIAEETCDDRYSRNSMVKYRKVRDRCVAELVEQLVSQVDNPRLTEIHESAAPRA